MLPHIVRIVLDELTHQEKELLEYKIFGQNSAMTTIILKYGDHDMVSDFILNGYTQSKYRRPPYRTPSQLHRDNGRVLHDCESKRINKANDSGVFTPGGQGPFRFSTSGPTDTEQLDHSCESLEDVPVPNPPSGSNPISPLFKAWNNSKETTADMEVKCMDMVGKCDIGTDCGDLVGKWDIGTSCDDLVGKWDIGTDCCDLSLPGVDAETDCADLSVAKADVGTDCCKFKEVVEACTQAGCSVSGQVSVGVSCRNRVGNHSTRTQTNTIYTYSVGVNCSSEYV
jgi:hypothetical protein